ncbi:hypothetical protein B0H10DRAFT_2018305 [Mycena sp. CBHHK59/15]|nr:hypothetical protein B0H10DRAFT_2018305 [Mycena sp. CBHHK59/15]
MANPQISPISQLLNSLGITREDLEKRSDQMRQFLTAESATPSRVPSNQLSSSASEPRSLSRASSSTAALTRQTSSMSSASVRDASHTPAPTPVKPEPEEVTIPVRQFDSMEMVLERQRLNRKKKRSKKRDQELPTWTTLPQPESPTSPDASPSNVSQPSSARLRDDSWGMGVLSQKALCKSVTFPAQCLLIYADSHLQPEAPAVKTESPSAAPSRPPAQSYPYPYYYYSAYTPQSRFPSLSFRSAQASSSARPKTPVKTSRPPRDDSPSPSPRKSPLPPSSPPASSQVSSPAHRLVNIVSSPGPMNEVPEEDEEPPYTLPPGPYSNERPHYSYAALIGQAVLSSRDHRLTLQEIYEWITTVYPHFKRGEQTWMNSIRHVLSTTSAFRKVSRERSAGRSHWAIFDEDLECFLDGGYRKHGSMLRTRGGSRSKPKKRSAEEVEKEETSPSLVKSAKRPKKTLPSSLPIPSLSSSLSQSSPEHPPFLLPALIHPEGKSFTRTQPATHRQTYYESCMPPPPASVPSEIIFPPLPNSSYRLIAASVSAPTGNRADDDEFEEAEGQDDGERSSPIASASTPEMSSRDTRPSSTSSASIPALTPNRSSSSPIPTSEMDVDPDQQAAQNVPRRKRLEDLCHFNVSVTVTGVDGEESVSADSLLRPVQFWDESSGGDGDALQPGIELHEYTTQDEPHDDEEDSRKSQQKAAEVKIKARPLVRMPTSPTLNRRKTATAVRGGNKSGKRKKAKSAKAPLAGAPSTPPRNFRRKIQLSPVHTPLSHKGLHMSPSASLAHYKSNLDPPPALVYGAAKRFAIRRGEGDDYDDDSATDPMRTPSRKRNVAGSSVPPVTPKKLLFPSDSSSPFRTPGGGALGPSPFRTPSGRGGIFDPHDPSTLLDEELSSLGAAGHGYSPSGLYGKETLYDSPNPLDGSPGKWARWW